MKLVLTSFMIDPELKERLARMAKALNCSASELMRTAINDSVTFLEQKFNSADSTS